MRAHTLITSGTLLFLLQFLTVHTFAQFSKESLQPLRLSPEQIKKHNVKSVIGMFLVNTSELDDMEDYMQGEKDEEFLNSKTKQKLRNLMLLTSMVSYITYDQNGNVTMETDLGKKEVSFYEYDNKNNLLEYRQVELNYNYNMRSGIVLQYAFDDKNNKISEFNGNMKTTFTRNNKGEVTAWKVMQTAYDNEAQKDVSALYKYDKEGRLLVYTNGNYRDEYQYLTKPKQTISTTYHNDEVYSKIISEFDTQNRLIKREYYKPRNESIQLFSITTFTYDKAGNYLSKNTKHELEPALNEQLQYKFITGSDGLPVKREIYQNKQLLGTETFFYEHF